MTTYELRRLLDWCECSRSTDGYIRRLVAASVFYNQDTRLAILAFVAWLVQP